MRLMRRGGVGIGVSTSLSITKRGPKRSLKGSSRNGWTASSARDRSAQACLQKWRLSHWAMEYSDLDP